jgi:RNA 3'-terminal phosphate cyclase (ATP)
LVEIDGSMGEGGGQILRTALALSAITGKPMRVYNIRARRDNPGLRPQHLTAVKAIAQICNARVKGAEVGSMTLEFYPSAIKGGSYIFDVGTAGSVPLVLQALLPVLAFADKPVIVKIRGGTDVPMAPTIDYVREVLARLTETLGYRFTVRVERRGHYPKGGGMVTVTVDQPPGGFKPRDFTERGELREIALRSHAVKLPRHVAERQANSATAILREKLRVEPKVEIEHGEDTLGPGSGITIWAIFDNTVMGSDSLGAPGKRAEIVGEEAAIKLVEDVATGATLDRHASDMIPLYLALAKGTSRIHGAKLTLHTITVLELLKQTLEIQYTLEGSEGKPFKATLYC